MRHVEQVFEGWPTAGGRVSGGVAPPVGQKRAVRDAVVRSRVERCSGWAAAWRVIWELAPTVLGY